MFVRDKSFSTYKHLLINTLRLIYVYFILVKFHNMRRYGASLLSNDKAAELHISHSHITLYHYQYQIPNIEVYSYHESMPSS